MERNGTDKGKRKSKRRKTKEKGMTPAPLSAYS
jgi:hypothetical protein